MRLWFLSSVVALLLLLYVGISCGGFAGDTMHMARLWDTSRDKVSGSVANKSSEKKGYSLEALSADLLGEAEVAKVSMKDLFGVARMKKDGGASKLLDIPDVCQLQMDPMFRDKWIRYSAKDALATWWLYDILVGKLKAMPWVINGRKHLGHMMEYYDSYMVDFGQIW